jgi:hypothetical protein
MAAHQTARLHLNHLQNVCSTAMLRAPAGATHAAHMVHETACLGAAPHMLLLACSPVALHSMAAPQEGRQRGMLAL